MEQSKEQKRVMDQVINEAWNNPKFKKELIDSPIEAIERFTGKKVTLPNGRSKMQVVDQTDPNCSYLNIPAKPNLENVELNEEQLEFIAGGVQGDGEGGGCTPVIIIPPFNI